MSHRKSDLDRTRGQRSRKARRKARLNELRARFKGAGKPKPPPKKRKGTGFGGVVGRTGTIIPVSERKGGERFRDKDSRRETITQKFRRTGRAPSVSSVRDRRERREDRPATQAPPRERPAESKRRATPRTAPPRPISRAPSRSQEVGRFNRASATIAANLPGKPDIVGSPATTRKAPPDIVDLSRERFSEVNSRPTVRDIVDVSRESVNNTEFSRLLQGFVSGELDASVLLATGKPGTNEVFLRPGQQDAYVRANKRFKEAEGFQIFLDRLRTSEQIDLAGERPGEAPEKPRGVTGGEVIRLQLSKDQRNILQSVADGLNETFLGKPTATTEKRLANEAAEKAIRRDVSKGLQKWMPDDEYEQFVKDARWTREYAEQLGVKPSGKSVTDPQTTEEKKFAIYLFENKIHPSQTGKDTAETVLAQAIPVAKIVKFATRSLRPVTSGVTQRLPTKAQITQRFQQFIDDAVSQREITLGSGPVPQRGAGEGVKKATQVITKDRPGSGRGGIESKGKRSRRPGESSVEATRRRKPPTKQEIDAAFRDLSKAIERSKPKPPPPPKPELKRRFGPQKETGAERAKRLEVEKAKQELERFNRQKAAARQKAKRQELEASESFKRAEAAAKKRAAENIQRNIDEAKRRSQAAEPLPRAKAAPFRIPKPKLKPQPGTQTAPQTDAVAGTQTQVSTLAQPRVKPKTKPEAKPDAKPEPSTKPGAKRQPATKPAAKVVPRPKPATKPDAKTKPEPKPKPKPGPAGKPRPKPEPGKPTPEPKPTPKPDPVTTDVPPPPGTPPPPGKPTKKKIPRPRPTPVKPGPTPPPKPRPRLPEDEKREFSLPSGKLPEGQFPAVVQFPQGEFIVTVNLLTNKREFKPNNTRFTRPRENFQVLRTTTKRPTPTNIPLGITQIGVTQTGLMFKRRRSGLR